MYVKRKKTVKEYHFKRWVWCLITVMIVQCFPANAQGLGEWTASRVAERMLAERQKLRSGVVRGEGWLTEKDRRLAEGANWEKARYDNPLRLDASFDYVKGLLFFDFRGNRQSSEPTRELYFKQPKYAAFLINLNTHRGRDDIKLTDPAVDRPEGVAISHFMPDFRKVGLGDLTSAWPLEKWVEHFSAGGWGSNFEPTSINDGILTMLGTGKVRRHRIEIDMNRGFTIVQISDQWNPPHMDWRTQGTKDGEFETIGTTTIIWNSQGDVYYPVTINQEGVGPFFDRSKPRELATVPDANLRFRKLHWEFTWSDVNQRQDPKRFDYRSVTYDRPTEVYGIDGKLVEILGEDLIAISASASRNWWKSPWILGLLIVIACVAGYFGWWRKP